LRYRPTAGVAGQDGWLLPRDDSERGGRAAGGPYANSASRRGWAANLGGRLMGAGRRNGTIHSAPSSAGRSAALGHHALGLLGGHECDRQPELLHAAGQVPTQPV
jgi:hypothetical protein